MSDRFQLVAAFFIGFSTAIAIFFSILWFNPTTVTVGDIVFMWRPMWWRTVVVVATISSVVATIALFTDVIGSRRHEAAMKG